MRKTQKRSETPDVVLDIVFRHSAVTNILGIVNGHDSSWKLHYSKPKRFESKVSTKSYLFYAARKEKDQNLSYKYLIVSIILWRNVVSAILDSEFGGWFLFVQKHTLRGWVTQVLVYTPTMAQTTVNTITLLL